MYERQREKEKERLEADLVTAHTLQITAMSGKTPRSQCFIGKDKSKI